MIAAMFGVYVPSRLVSGSVRIDLSNAKLELKNDANDNDKRKRRV